MRINKKLHVISLLSRGGIWVGFISFFLCERLEGQLLVGVVWNELLFGCAKMGHATIGIDWERRWRVMSNNKLRFSFQFYGKHLFAALLIPCYGQREFIFSFINIKHISSTNDKKNSQNLNVNCYITIFFEIRDRNVSWMGRHDWWSVDIDQTLYIDTMHTNDEITNGASVFIIFREPPVLCANSRLQRKSRNQKSSKNDR